VAASRIVAFAGQTVEVSVALEEGQEILDFLYSDIDHTAVSQANSKLKLVQTATGDYRIESNLELDSPTSTDNCNEAIRLLMDKTIYCLAAACHGGLLMHAAVMAQNGCAVIMPAASGAGKSTLSSWLAQQGFQYGTDELVFLPTGSDRVECLTRPVIIKNAANKMMTALLGLAGREQNFYPGPVAMMLPRQSISNRAKCLNPRISRILFPHFRQDATFQHARLSSAQTGMHLMSVLVNARNLPDHGFIETARIARNVPAYELHYSSFDQISSHFAEIFSTTDMTRR